MNHPCNCHTISRANTRSSTALESRVQTRRLHLSVETLHMGICNTIDARMQAVGSSLEDVSERQRRIEQSMDRLDHAGSKSDSRFQEVESLLHESPSRHSIQGEPLHEIKRTIADPPRELKALPGSSRDTGFTMKESLEQHRAQGKSIRVIAERRSGLDLGPALNAHKAEQDVSQELSDNTHDHDTMKAMDQSQDAAVSMTSVLKLTQSQCDSACVCACHRRSRFGSPNFLNAVLGSLFVGYQASPRSAQRCNRHVCQLRSRRITYTYAFPQWLLNRVLFCNLDTVMQMVRSSVSE